MHFPHSAAALTCSWEKVNFDQAESSFQPIKRGLVGVDVNESLFLRLGSFHLIPISPSFDSLEGNEINFDFILE